MCGQMFVRVCLAASVMVALVVSSETAWEVNAPSGERYVELKQLMRGLDLHTVCEEARCPNIGECWAAGTATIMLMGDTCTRACRFCAVKTAHPHGVLDADEPEKVADAVHRMSLRYVVLTSVDRDDLPDGGAGHFAATIRAIKERDPKILVESLIPDFVGDRDGLRTVVEAGGDVVAHNVEVTRQLTPKIRDRRCNYDQSLGVLQSLKEIRPSLFTKSSVMLGLGETHDELLETMRDLRAVDCDIVTFGQYLRPTPRHHPVVEYVTPERFAELKEQALELGFRFCASGPLVRSSYKAAEFFVENALKDRAHNASEGSDVDGGSTTDDAEELHS